MTYERSSGGTQPGGYYNRDDRDRGRGHGSGHSATRSEICKYPAEKPISVETTATPMIREVAYSAGASSAAIQPNGMSASDQ